jgi:hypothetical protein
MMTKTMTRGGDRMHAAGIRAIDAHKRLRSKAATLSREMDEVTSPHGIPVTNLSEEDSMVIAIDRVVASGSKRR